MCKCPLLYNVISPFHVPSDKPSFSTRFCHRGPPLSFLLRYFNSFALLCTSSLKFLLLCLSMVPLVSKKSATARILAVRMAICTSLLPVSAPTRSTFCCSPPVVAAEASLGDSVCSVLCRPKTSMHLCLFTLNLSLLLPNDKLEIRRNASSAVVRSSSSLFWRASGVTSVVKSAKADIERVQSELLVPEPLDSSANIASIISALSPRGRFWPPSCSLRLSDSSGSS